MVGCTCASPDALPWIRDVFRECVSSSIELTGFYLALLTIACWIAAQWPQLLYNCRVKRARGLSPWFLIQWLAGDAFNLIGCIDTGDQAPTQTYTAVYFVCSDVALLAQYLYYEGTSDDTSSAASESESDEGVRAPLASRRRRPSSVGARGTLGIIAGFAATAAVGVALAATRGVSTTRAGTSTFASSGGGASPSPDDCSYNGNPQWMQNFGRGVGYLAMLFYLGGRMAQIAKNKRRRSGEGLSLSMFALAISANVSYGVSILCASRTKAALLRSLPWLGGSFGTVALDCAILAQSAAFGTKRIRERETSDEEEDVDNGIRDEL